MKNLAIYLGFLLLAITPGGIKASESTRFIFIAADMENPMSPPVLFLYGDGDGQLSLVKRFKDIGSVSEIQCFSNLRKAVLWQTNSEGIRMATMVDIDLLEAYNYAIPFTSPSFNCFSYDKRRGKFFLATSYRIKDGIDIPFTCGLGENYFSAAKEPFFWDSAMITTRPSSQGNWKYIRLVGDESGKICIRMNNVMYPIEMEIPDGLKKTVLDGSASDDANALLIYNSQKLCVVLTGANPGADPFFHIYDKVDKTWNVHPTSLNGFGYARFYDSWILLCGYDKNAHGEGYVSSSTGEYLFHASPSFKHAFAWKTFPGIEILYLDSNAIVYRKGDQIWVGDIETDGIINERMFAEGRIVPFVHWAIPALREYQTKKEDILFVIANGVSVYALSSDLPIAGTVAEAKTSDEALRGQAAVDQDEPAESRLTSGRRRESERKQSQREFDSHNIDDQVLPDPPGILPGNKAVLRPVPK